MEKNIFDQPVKNELRTYDNIQKITTSKGDDYTTSCLLDHNYIKNYYKMITINLSKSNSDTKVIQQINFAANLLF